MTEMRENLLLVVMGGCGYCLLETVWRQYTHWSMGITGGVCLLLIYRMEQRVGDHPLWKRCVMGALIITWLEYITGCVVNLTLGWEVWDYSDVWCNLRGQVCPLYSVLWAILCIPVFGLCRRLRQLRRDSEKVS